MTRMILLFILAIEISFLTSDGAYAAGDPLAACKSGKVKAASAKCKGLLGCWGKWLKDPDKDPIREKLDACIGKAEGKFASAWDKAEAKAAKKGADCAVTASMAEIEELIDSAVEDIMAEISAGIDLENKDSRALGSSLLKAAGRKCAALLRAESKHLKKPAPDKLGRSRTKAAETFEKSWEKAIAKAAKKGVTYNGASMNDIEGKVDALVFAIMARIEPVKITVGGKVIFDDGNPVEGAGILGFAVRPEAVLALRASQRRRAEQMDWTKPGFKKRAQLRQDAPARLSLETSEASNAVTDANGNFTLQIGPTLLPLRALVEVSFQPDSFPVVETARWGDVENDTVDMGTIVIPNPQGSEVPIAGGEGQSADGAIRVEGLPAEVDRLFGRSYDPDENPDAFPGEFAEMGGIPLNSSVFVWMEALDANGAPVNDLSQAATIRSRIPQSQWIDLEDINSGTDRIEIPIYTYNEDTNMWEQQPEVGWLEDDQGTVLPEDAESVILDGAFAGDIFATFTTGHLSWMNVDYAFIGPWTLSRLDASKRNNDCLFKALQLAKRIALSQRGRAAYANVNQAGADIGDELGDGMGPELKNSPDSELSDEDGKVWGRYTGDSGGSETQFEMNNDMWDGCGEGATEEQKKNTILRMTVNILHETAHWKDDVKKYPKDADGNEPDPHDTPGEEGTQLERDLFGGNLGQRPNGQPTIDPNGPAGKRDVTAAERDGWLNPDNWPPPPSGGAGQIVRSVGQLQNEPPVMDVTISLPKDTFELGEELPVRVAYKNVSTAPIQVVNFVKLEGYPLYFNIIDQASGARVPFIGSEIELELDENAFTTLQPGETLTQDVNLVRDPTSGDLLYQFIRSGGFDLTAIYEEFDNVAQAASNTIAFTLNPGGSISGAVTNATNAQPIAGAVIKVIQSGNVAAAANANGNVLATAVTDANGDYAIPELPAGVYTLQASAPGFLRSAEENVQVIVEQDTVVNFSLSPLLATGELRLVLTWGENPRDLDSHLWLPTEKPYHLNFGRKGNAEDCPFALLDVDDVSSFGPETITISQRFLLGTYVYAIHNFSGFPDITGSQAQVQVFDSTGLIATYDVPTEGAGRWWNVLTIDGATGAITEINELGDNPEPYGDTDLGCQAQ